MSDSNWLFDYNTEKNLVSKIKAAISSDLSYRPFTNPECLLFFRSNQTPSPGNEDEEMVKERIVQVIEELSHCYFVEILVQYWTPVTMTTGGGCYLTTSDQPFGICGYSSRLCEFRKLSLDYKAYVDTIGSTENELGPIGRVFIKKSKEWLGVGQGLSCSSSEECLHLDHARQCQVQIISAVPMFRSSGLDCIGVVEIVYGSDQNSTDQSLISMVELFFHQFNSQDCQTLNISSPQDMVEELYSEVVPSFIENNIDSFHLYEATKSPPRTKGLHNEGGTTTVQMDSSFHHSGVEDDVRNEGGTTQMDSSFHHSSVNMNIVEERNIIDDVDSKKEDKIKSSKREYRKTKTSISKEVLEEHFHMKLKDAAKILKTSPSTLKRQCRNNEISRWPAQGRKKVNHRPSSKPPPKQAITQASHKKLLNEEMEDEMIATIKATYKKATTEGPLAKKKKTASSSQLVHEESKEEVQPIGSINQSSATRPRVELVPLQVPTTIERANVVLKEVAERGPILPRIIPPLSPSDGEEDVPPTCQPEAEQVIISPSSEDVPKDTDVDTKVEQAVNLAPGWSDDVAGLSNTNNVEETTLIIEDERLLAEPSITGENVQPVQAETSEIPIGASANPQPDPEDTTPAPASQSDSGVVASTTSEPIPQEAPASSIPAPIQVVPPIVGPEPSLPFDDFFTQLDVGAFDLGSLEPEAATPSNLQRAKELVLGLSSTDLSALPSIAEVESALVSLLTDSSISAGQSAMLREVQERLPGCQTLIQMASLSQREAETHLASRKKLMDFLETAKAKYQTGKGTRAQIVTKAGQIQTMIANLKAQIQKLEAEDVTNDEALAQVNTDLSRLGEDAQRYKLQLQHNLPADQAWAQQLQRAQRDQTGAEKSWQDLQEKLKNFESV